MVRTLRRTVLLVGCALGTTYCTTTKDDVRKEWEEVEEQRAKAQKTTQKYAEERKEKYEKDAEKRIKKAEEQLVQLRVDRVNATGTHRENLQDRIWQLEREIAEANAGLRDLKNRSAVGADDAMSKLDEKLSGIESLINETQNLAH